MDIRPALKSQYHASLNALKLAVERCPDSLWNSPDDGSATFWRVAYHALFYTYFYLQRNQHSFTPWKKHRADAECLGSVAWDGDRPPHACEQYTRDDILEYWQVCDDMIDSAVDGLDLSAAECGFPWYPMSKLEHQLVNIRHLQHHAAALATRLRREAGVDVPWVGR